MLAQAPRARSAGKLRLDVDRLAGERVREGETCMRGETAVEGQEPARRTPGHRRLAGRSRPDGRGSGASGRSRAAPAAARSGSRSSHDGEVRHRLRGASRCRVTAASARAGPGRSERRCAPTTSAGCHERASCTRARARGGARAAAACDAPPRFARRRADRTCRDRAGARCPADYDRPPVCSVHDERRGKRPAAVTRPRVDDDAGWLVDDEQMLVLVRDRQIGGRRLVLEPARAPGLRTQRVHPRAAGGSSCRGSPSTRHQPALDQTLGDRTRPDAGLGGEVAVEPQAGGGLRDDELDQEPIVEAPWRRRGLRSPDSIVADEQDDADDDAARQRG